MRGEMLFVLTRCFVQVGDGTSGTNRLTPVAVVGLGSGVANVAVGGVRVFVQRVCLLLYWGVVGCAVGRVGLLQSAWFAVWGLRSGWLRVLVGVGCGVMNGCARRASCMGHRLILARF